MKTTMMLFAGMLALSGLCYLGAWSHAGVDYTPGPETRFPPKSAPEVATLLVDAVIDTGIRVATGYWPCQIHQIASRPHPKNLGSAYHRFASYEMAKRVGPRIARYMGRMKESSDYAPDKSDLVDNEVGISAAEAGRPNPVTGHAALSVGF